MLFNSLTFVIFFIVLWLSTIVDWAVAKKLYLESRQAAENVVERSKLPVLVLPVRDA